jgi:hypothetical protein
MSPHFLKKKNFEVKSTIRNDLERKKTLKIDMRPTSFN